MVVVVSDGTSGAAEGLKGLEEGIEDVVGTDDGETGESMVGAIVNGNSVELGVNVGTVGE